jgi:hypothetical protein
MQRRHSPYAWKAWRDTIIAVVVVIAIGSLASASPSLRAPRGTHESVRIVPSGATEAGGPAGASGPMRTTAPEIGPAEQGTSHSGGADFTACKGLTGLDNAICRHEALLVVHPDNHGLQNSLTHLQNKAEHEAKGQGGEGNVPPENGSSSNSSNGQGHGHGHDQSAEPHGNAGGNGHGNSHGNSHANGHGNGHANNGKDH